MNGPGCGGSSYIGNHLLINKIMYCYNCTESSAAETKTISTTCNEDTPTENCAKKGNGYAKITLIANINVEYYNDNVKTDVIANKTTYNFDKIECSKGSNLTWDNDNWKFVINDYQENDTCKIYFSSKTTIELAYTGTEEKVVIPKTGFYKLETWGAQGNSSTLGYGAYANGTVALNKGDKLYITVGGNTSTTTGGYNGGGTGNHVGGGATHIAKVSGLLSTLSSNTSNILIVSGGGGGAGQSGSGGSAGGIEGTRGVTDYCPDGTLKGGYGGTQTAGGRVVDTNWAQVGSFGRGGNAIQNQTGGGGGSGYYGGGSGTSGDCYGGGGGGSSYIGNSLLTDKVMYCYNCTESKETVTKTVTTTCNEEIPTENCAKKGNGYAKITLIKEN